jgi:hypothetical protein
MAFQINLQHFRIFEQTGDVTIRPITLLTGGNSAGKSSFLAGIRYLSDIDYYGSTNASFNKDPFYLGSFEQIAHYRGGKAGRAKDFVLGYKGDSASNGPFSRRQSKPISISLHFVKNLSQPALRKFAYESRNERIQITISANWKSASIDVDLPDFNTSVSMGIPRGISTELSGTNPSFVTFLFEAALRQGRDSNGRPNEAQASDIARASAIADDLRGALSAVPRTSYVGAPVRTRPSRTYDPIEVTQQAEGSHVPSQMAQLARTAPQEWASIRERLVDFGRSSTLFNDIEVRSLGRSDSDPFQINVVINGPKRNIIDVGYGVSQAIPIIYELVRRARDTIYIAQQPEVHLHPEAQAALGTFISHDIKRIPGYIILETHSDFLIDRVRRHIKEGVISKDDVSLLYFSRKALSAEVYEIALDDSGDIIDAPDDYRDFFIREDLTNLGF